MKDRYCARKRALSVSGMGSPFSGVPGPPACLPQLGAQTRFRLDAFLWEPPGSLEEQWWERVPADGGFSHLRCPSDEPSRDDSE